MNKPKIQVARQMTKIHDTLPTNLNNLAPVYETPGRNWRFQWDPQCHASNTYASRPPLKHRHRKVAVSREGRATLSIERRATLSDKKRKANRNVRISKVYLFTQDEMMRMMNTLQIEDCIRGIIPFWYVRPCQSAKP